MDHYLLMQPLIIQFFFNEINISWNDSTFSNTFPLLPYHQYTVDGFICTVCLLFYNNRNTIYYSRLVMKLIQVYQ